MESVLRYFFIAMFPGGVFLIAGFFIYCKFSGKVIFEEEIPVEDAPILLGAEMNPIRVYIKGSYATAGTIPTGSTFKAELRLRDRIVWAEEGTAVAGREPHTALNYVNEVKLFRIGVRGSYAFSLSVGPHDEFGLTGMSVVMRRNVKLFRPWMVVLGAGLSVASMFFLAA